MKEIELTPGKKENQVKTIYFGGGTPSLVQAADLGKILHVIRKQFDIDPGAEITIEANPDDITESRAEEWLKLGINRLSIGIQSFHEHDLQWMNRAHDAKQAARSIEIIRQTGFTNFSIDLIFGSPVTSMDDWTSNVAKVIELNVPHISAYALTVEPQTALDKMIRLHKKQSTDPDQQAEQYEYLMKAMARAGYEHYEISSFCLPGMYSRHNSSYWKGSVYFGFGPSAHSFDGLKRRWNVASNPAYIKSLSEGIIPFEEELITPVKKMNEYIMTALRTSSGLDLIYFKNEWGEAALEQIKKDAIVTIQQEHAIITDEKIVLTDQGKLFADGIAASLFAVE